MRCEYQTNRRSWLIAGACGCFALTRKSLGASGQQRLPASISALQSMRDQVRPITVGERRGRIVKAQRLMAENKMDAVLLVGGASLFYLTGIRWGNSERLFACLIPAHGKAFCVSPSFEEDRAREQLNRGPLEDAAVVTWHEDQNPHTLVAGVLKNLGISSGTLGIDERTPWVFSEGISKVTPSLHLVSATPITAGCRMLKSAHELDLMRLANRATLTVYQAVYHALEPGMSQNQAEELISAAYERVGFPGEASVETDAGSALPHGSEKPQKIRENSLVMIDDGCEVEGYNSDITRTFVIGKATDKMKRAFDLVKQAQSAALKAARPGLECQAVDAAARKVIVDGGYGPDYKYFSHRLGHGIGLEGHEWPYLVRGNTLPLAPGMTFSDEPGIYLPGQFGMRLEDDMYITSNGAELFTPQSPSLEHPFG